MKDATLADFNNTVLRVRGYLTRYRDSNIGTG